MPIYEYECKSCHHHFDLMQKISDAPATQCPQCFENSAIRLVSAAGFQLKGTGWYVTDFKNKPQKDNKQAASNAQSSSTDSQTKNQDTTKTADKQDKKEKE